MRGNSFRLLSVVVCTAVVVPIIGCAVAADLVNPAFLSALGLDPEAVLPSSGTVVVAFVNDSQLTARFFAYSLAEPGLLSSARNLVVDVEPGGSRFMVLDCPVGAFAPGTVSGNTVNTNAITVPPEGGTDVFQFAWDGDSLIGGVDFQCGDVIQVAYSLEQGLGFIITVVPGR